MSRRENTRNNLREEISNAHKFGKVYMTFILPSEIVLSSGNNCQFLQDWTAHQIYHKVRICNCQRNLKMRKRNFKKLHFAC